jgi:glycosyltransferase involved in cell wall biosynthesis
MDTYLPTHSLRAAPAMMAYPPEALDAPDLRACEPRAEIDRCRRLLAWLAAVPVADLLQASPPRDGDDLVTVVVPMYNAADWIELCLKGLLAQTHANQEIVCVDDGSSDGTYERVVRRFAADPRVCAVRLARNVGPYQIKNWVASSLARGRWIAFQDADDVSHPMRLAAQRRWMLDTGESLCGTCAHQFFPPAIQRAAGTGGAVAADGLLHNLAYFRPVEWAPEMTVEDRGALVARAAAFRADSGGGPFKVYPKSLAKHATLMVERALVLALGGFDARTRVGADSDFSVRVVRFQRLGNLPTVLYSRRFHSRSLTEDPATGMTSPARLEYRARRAEREAEIRTALGAGDIDRVRALNRFDLYCGEVVVAEHNRAFAARFTPTAGSS